MTLASGFALPRDPGQPKRTRRFMDLLSQLMNALIGSGVFTQSYQGQWNIATNTDQQILANQIFGP